MGPFKRRTFISISAQEDNLGDIEIRQVALDIIGRSGLPCEVLVGAMSPSYVEAYAFPRGCNAHVNNSRFALAFLKSLLFERPNLMLAPGPYVIPRKISGIFRSLALLLLVAAVRCRGGRVVSVGRALRGGGVWGVRLQQAQVKLSNYFVCRDHISSHTLGMAVQVAPDLALSRQAESKPGAIAAISVRGDHSLRLESVQSLVTRLRALDLEPVFVTQVRRDDEQHASLAAATGCSVVEWGAKSHIEQLKLVREIYAESQIVITNRLHAAIFGLQHGAMPVVLKRTDPDKLLGSLGHLVDLQEISALNEGPWEVFKPEPAELQYLRECLATVRSRLCEVHAIAARTLAGDLVAHNMMER